MDPVREKAQAARDAALRLQTLPDGVRARGVRAIAAALRDAAPRLLEANRQDLEAAGDLPPALRDRLKLSTGKLALALQGVEQVADLPDPVGRTLRATRLDEGLDLYQVTVPLGVVACIFESRPDAAIQIPALALRSANAVLLKGGTEAQKTNRAIVEAIRAALAAEEWPVDAVQLLEGRGEVADVLRHDDLVDLVVPRGSSAFVRHVMASTRIPVLGHAEGVCHVYLDGAADPARAIRLCVDAKTDYPAACNAAETFLVDRAASHLVKPLVEALAKTGVEVLASPDALPLAGGLAKPASPEDFGREWGDLVCSLALVDGVEEAIRFVNRHGSRHTDVIVTQREEAARRFVEGVDSANVFVNASPRFADGYRYGLGAELGISTGKIHARGPVGLEGLTSTKWVLLGHGHRAGDYQGAHARPFLHEANPTRLEDAWHG